MYIKEISLAYSVKKSDGNYGSREAVVGAVVSLDETDTPKIAFENLKLMLLEQLSLEMSRISQF